jgi:hypothetical protein
MHIPGVKWHAASNVRQSALCGLVRYLHNYDSIRTKGRQGGRIQSNIL